MLVPQMPVNHGRRAGGGRYAERRLRLASASQMRQRRLGSYQSAWPCRRQPREVVARPSAATFTGGWCSEQYGVGVACAARTGTRHTQQREVGMAWIVAPALYAPPSSFRGDRIHTKFSEVEFGEQGGEGGNTPPFRAFPLLGLHYPETEFTEFRNFELRHPCASPCASRTRSPADRCGSLRKPCTPRIWLAAGKL